jgi:hypothetical protein
MAQLGVEISGRADRQTGLCSHSYRCTRCGKSWWELEFITPEEAVVRAHAHVCNDDASELM